MSVRKSRLARKHQAMFRQVRFTHGADVLRFFKEAIDELPAGQPLDVDRILNLARRRRNKSVAQRASAVSLRGFNTI